MLPGCWVPTRTMRMRAAATKSAAAGVEGVSMPAMLNFAPRPERRHRSFPPPSPAPPRGRHAMLKPAVNVMIKAARAGGNVLLRHMNRLDALNIVEKARMDYASEVDGLAEAEIVKELRRAYPEYAVLGEEGGRQAGRGPGGRATWVIDPLDGTSNYLHGWPHWCVSIALVENGEPVHAVVFDPLRNELFTATRGAGAQLNERRFRIGDRKDLSGAMLITGFPPRDRAHLAPQLDTLRGL